MSLEGPIEEIAKAEAQAAEDLLRQLGIPVLCPPFLTNFQFFLVTIFKFLSCGIISQLAARGLCVLFF